MDNYFWSLQVNAFIKEIVQSNQTEKTIIIGNSLGALVALTTAALQPDLVKAVIAAPLPDPALMKSHKIRPPKWLQKAKNHLITIMFKLFPIELLLTLITKTKLIYIALQSAYNRSIQKDFELKKIVLEPTQRKTAPRALRAMCIGMTTRKDAITAPFLLSKLRSIPNHAPVFLAWGKNDKFIPLLIGKRLLLQFPWLKLFVFDKVGHCPHDESPDKFNQNVLNWLKII